MNNNSEKGRSIKMIVLILFIIYIGSLIYLVFLSPKFGRVVSVDHKYNLKPFQTISNFIRYGDFGMQVTNILGNIVAFIPMGFFVPLIFERYNNLFKTAIIVLFSSLLIEVVQYEFKVGAFDVDDIFLNVLGGILGYLMIKWIKQFLEEKSLEKQ